MSQSSPTSQRRLLSPTETAEALTQLGAPWVINTKGELYAQWQFKRAGGAGFDKVATMLQTIVAVSKKYNHHPQVTFGECELAVTYITHSAGGLTPLDFKCAVAMSEQATQLQLA